jgi:hypothetical protein
MERKAKSVKTEELEEVVQEPRLRWSHTGGGSFWLNNHIIKPGQVFYAKASEVPEAFRDQLKPLDGTPDPDRKPVVGVQSTFKMVALEAEGDEEVKYNVVNEKGKAINGKPLTEEKAKALLQDLQA